MANIKRTVVNSKQNRDTALELKKAKDGLNADLASARLIAMNLGEQNLSKVTASEIKNFQELTKRIQSDDGNFSLSNKEIDALSSFQKKLNSAAEYMIKNNQNYNQSLSNIIHNFAVTINDTKNTTSVRTQHLDDLKKILAASGKSAGGVGINDFDHNTVKGLLDQVGNATVSSQTLAKVAPNSIYTNAPAGQMTRMQKLRSGTRSMAKSAASGAASSLAEGVLDATFNHFGLQHVNQQFKLAEKIHGAVFNRQSSDNSDHPLRSVIHDTHDNAGKMSAIRDFTEPPSDKPTKVRKPRSTDDEVRLAPKSFRPTDSDEETVSTGRRRRKSNSGGGFDTGTVTRMLDLLEDTMEYNKTLVKNTELTNEKLDQLIKFMDPQKHNVDSSKFEQKLGDDIDTSGKKNESNAMSQTKSDDKEGVFDKAKNWLKDNAGSVGKQVVKYGGLAATAVGEGALAVPAAVGAATYAVKQGVDAYVAPVVGNVASAVGGAIGGLFGGPDSKELDLRQQAYENAQKKRSWTNALTFGLADSDSFDPGEEYRKLKGSNAEQTMTARPDLGDKVTINPEPSVASPVQAIKDNVTNPPSVAPTSVAPIASSSGINEIVPLIKRETQILVKLEDTLSALIAAMSRSQLGGSVSGGGGGSYSGGGGSSGSNAGSTSGSMSGGGSGSAVTPSSGGMGHALDVTRTPRGGGGVSSTPNATLSPEQVAQINTSSDQLQYANAQASLHGEDPNSPVMQRIQGQITANADKLASNGASSGPSSEASTPGKQGQYRPVRDVTARDIDPRVISTIAGEAVIKDPKSVDAVINNMYNRLGTKGFGKSNDLLDVASAKGQYAAYGNNKQVSEKNAAMIADRIKAIGSGSVPDITHGSNVYRAGWYGTAGHEGYGKTWSRNHVLGANAAPIIGGNRFAYEASGGKGTYASYDKPHDDAGTPEAKASNAGKPGQAQPAGTTAVPDSLTPKSRRELSGINKDLANNFLEASKRSGIQFQVTQGMRNQEEANANSRSGAGVKDSQHLYGAAADLKMIDPKTGKPSMDRSLYERFGASFNEIAKEQKTGQRWLGALKGRWGKDYVHFDQGIRYGQTHERTPFGMQPTQSELAANPSLAGKQMAEVAPTKADIAEGNKDAYTSPGNPFGAKTAVEAARNAPSASNAAPVAAQISNAVYKPGSQDGLISFGGPTAETTQVSDAVHRGSHGPMGSAYVNPSSFRPSHGPMGPTYTDQRTRDDRYIRESRNKDDTETALANMGQGGIGSTPQRTPLLRNSRTKDDFNYANMGQGGIGSTPQRISTGTSPYTLDKGDIEHSVGTYKAQDGSIKNATVSKNEMGREGHGVSTTRVATTTPIVNQAPLPPPRPVNPTNPPVNDTTPRMTESTTAGSTGSGRPPTTPSSHGKDGHKKPNKHVDDLMLAAYNRGLLHHNVG